MHTHTNMCTHTHTHIYTTYLTICTHTGITPHMTEELRELEGLLGHYKQHLRQQCQTLAREIREKRLSEPSVTDWLSQVQELKQEKIGLME